MIFSLSTSGNFGQVRANRTLSGMCGCGLCFVVGFVCVFEFVWNFAGFCGVLWVLGMGFGLWKAFGGFWVFLLSVVGFGGLLFGFREIGACELLVDYC